MTWSPDATKAGHAADALNRGIAMVKTVMLALDGSQDPDDIEHIRDTLYEAERKLAEAENLLGLYKSGAA